MVKIIISKLWHSLILSAILLYNWFAQIILNDFLEETDYA